MIRYKTIVYDKSKTVEHVQSTGLESFVGWDRLKPYLEQAIGLKDKEQAVGIIIGNDGITVKLLMNDA